MVSLDSELVPTLLNFVYINIETSYLQKKVLVRSNLNH
jgi:hypothetical protein